MMKKLMLSTLLVLSILDSGGCGNEELGKNPCDEHSESQKCLHYHHVDKTSSSGK